MCQFQFSGSSRTETRKQLAVVFHHLAFGGGAEKPSQGSGFQEVKVLNNTPIYQYQLPHSICLSPFFK